MTNFDFEFQVIPELMDDCRYGMDYDLFFRFPKQRLLVAAAFTFDDGIDYPFSDLNCQTMISEDYRQVLITFIKPDREPEAYYGLIIKYIDRLPVYFTLSKCKRGCMLCKPETDRLKKMRHYNHLITPD